RLPARRQQGPRHLRGALQTPSSFAGTARIRHSRRGQGCERRALAGPDVTLAIPTHQLFRPIRASHRYPAMASFGPLPRPNVFTRPRSEAEIQTDGVDGPLTTSAYQ